MLQITLWHLTRLERLVIFTLVLVVFGLAGGSESGSWWYTLPHSMIFHQRLCILQRLGEKEVCLCRMSIVGKALALWFVMLEHIRPLGGFTPMLVC
jgi:hypothetical protein